MGKRTKSTTIRIKGAGFLRDALEQTEKDFRHRVDAAIRSAMVETATPGLTEREREVYAQLTDQWARPMDVGGRDASWHSRALASLFRKGLVERKGISSYRYRNPQYVAPPPVKTRFDRAIEFTRILAGYGCAGVDQEPDDLTPCGKCGPCEAIAFLEKFDRSMARLKESKS